MAGEARKYSKCAAQKGKTIKTLLQQILKLLAYERQVVGESGGKCTLITIVVGVERATHTRVYECGGATRNES